MAGQNGLDVPLLAVEGLKTKPDHVTVLHLRMEEVIALEMSKRQNHATSIFAQVNEIGLFAKI